MMSDESSRHASQRQAMVADQLRRRGICDAKVLSVMGAVPRHLFIPEQHRGEAYSDNPVSSNTVYCDFPNIRGWGSVARGPDRDTGNKQVITFSHRLDARAINGYMLSAADRRKNTQVT